MDNKEVFQNEEDSKFVEMKKILQSILDRHLPPEKRLSVESFDKESVFYLCNLLLEKDDEKRDIIRKKIDKMRKDKMQEFQNDLAEIERKKAEFDNYLGVSKELDYLVDDISTENEMDVKLDNL